MKTDFSTRLVCAFGAALFILGTLYAIALSFV